MNNNVFNDALIEVRSCSLCVNDLPLGARPIVQIHPDAKILVAGQAPGLKVHKTGIPFDDASGDRLRLWMGVDKALFYDATKIAILPMGFCYPGKGKSGDLPPQKECSKQWRTRLLALMPDIELVLAIGQYAIRWHLPNTGKETLTNTVKSWRTHWPNTLPMPHPSPRNNIWIKNNTWFETEIIPVLQRQIKTIFSKGSE